MGTLAFVTIGTDRENNPVTIGDIERRSGLYVLGRPGMGKSTLLINLINQDIKHGHGLFFLDPHDEGIDDVLTRCDPRRIEDSCFLLDPTDKTHSFGINPLRCVNIHDPDIREETLYRSEAILQKLWGEDWGVWMENVLPPALRILIESQEYTLAELPLFLRDRAFREHVMSDIRYEEAARDYWQRFTKSDQDRMGPALIRLDPLLENRQVRHIVGQRETTLDIPKIIEERRIVLVKLSARLPRQAKAFIGTMLVSELLAAARRPRRVKSHFCIFIDEFQHVAAVEDIKTLITEARKWGFATTIAHQERYGQLSENKGIIGATDAAANRVFFQVTDNDADRSARSFAKVPPTETRYERELVISKEPFWELVRGHSNKRIAEIARRYFCHWVEQIRKLRAEMDSNRLVRTELMDEATQSRDIASIHGVDDRSYRYAPPGKDPLAGMGNALQRSLSAHEAATDAGRKLQWAQKKIQEYQDRIKIINDYLVAVMEGRSIPTSNTIYTTDGRGNFLIAPTPSRGKDVHAEYFIAALDDGYAQVIPKKVLEFYFYMRYGDYGAPRSIPVFPTILWINDEELVREMQEIFVAARTAIHAEAWDYQAREEIGHSRIYYNIGKRIEVEKRWSPERKAEYIRKNIKADLVGFPHKTVKEVGGNAVVEIIRGLRDDKPDFFAKVWRELPYVNEEPFTLPDFPPRVILWESNHHVVEEYGRQNLNGIIQSELMTRECNSDNSMFPRDVPVGAHGRFAELAYLLSEPENHIKTTTGQYIPREVPTRSPGEMVAEMAHELMNLIPGSAYARVIGSSVEGRPMVLTQKISTSDKPVLQNRIDPQGYLEAMTAKAKRNTISAGFAKERVLIEEELRHRREQWQAKSLEMQPNALPNKPVPLKKAEPPPKWDN